MLYLKLAVNQMFLLSNQHDLDYCVLHYHYETLCFHCLEHMASSDVPEKNLLLHQLFLQTPHSAMLSEDVDLYWLSSLLVQLLLVYHEISIVPYHFLLMLLVLWLGHHNDEECLWW